MPRPADSVLCLAEGLLAPGVIGLGIPEEPAEVGLAEGLLAPAGDVLGLRMPEEPVEVGVLGIGIPLPLCVGVPAEVMLEGENVSPSLDGVFGVGMPLPCGGGVTGDRSVGEASLIQWVGTGILDGE